MSSTAARFVRLENTIHRQLVGHSLTMLRVAVGATFLAFGLLKFFPGVSPAEDLVMETTDLLTLGVVPGDVALVAVAALECFIGVCLVTGRWMRVAIWLLAVQFVGILSPLVLLTGRLFSGPYGAPSLEGQYVLKDVILAAAGMVIAASTFRGGRLVRDEPADIPPGVSHPRRGVDPGRRLQVVLEGVREDRSVTQLCAEHGISEGQYYEWRDQVLTGAARTLHEDHEAALRTRPS